MRLKVLGLIIILSLALCGCAGRHLIDYDIIKPAMPPPKRGSLCILPLADERPQSERKGAKGKMLSFSSKDVHFSQEVACAIKELLSRELNNVGFAIVEESELPAYKISGSIKHFQASMSPAKITFVPYLGALSSLWAKDEFNIALNLYIKMLDQQGKALIDKTFSVSEDMKLPTGLLNLARYSRGFNHKLKLLDEALKDVLGQIRDEAIRAAKK